MKNFAKNALPVLVALLLGHFTFNPNWVTTSSIAPSSVQGLGLLYATVSTIRVAPGTCADRTNAAYMTLSSAVTLDTSANSSINHGELKAGAGTAALSGGTVTGTGTDFLTAGGPSGSPRALTVGTIGTGGASSTTITGAGTKFISAREVAIGDLICTATTAGRVTAVASDTSLTVVTALTITDGATGYVIEGSTVAIGGASTRVNKISSNTSMTVADSSTTVGAGASVYWGIPAATTDAVPVWGYVWLVSGGSGTGTIFSSQRTAPLNPPSGYTTYARRIGSLLVDASGNVAFFSQAGSSNERLYSWEFAINSNNSRLLSAGNATGWTAISTALILPPTSTLIRLNCFVYLPGSAQSLFTRPRGSGAANTSRPAIAEAITGQETHTPRLQITDGVGYIDYVGGAADASNFIDATGFIEWL